MIERGNIRPGSDDFPGYCRKVEARIESFGVDRTSAVSFVFSHPAEVMRHRKMGCSADLTGELLVREFRLVSQEEIYGRVEKDYVQWSDKEIDLHDKKCEWCGHLTFTAGTGNEFVREAAKHIEETPDCRRKQKLYIDAIVRVTDSIRQDLVLRGRYTRRSWLRLIRERIKEGKPPFTEGE